MTYYTLRHTLNTWHTTHLFTHYTHDILHTSPVSGCLNESRQACSIIRGSPTWYIYIYIYIRYISISSFYTYWIYIYMYEYIYRRHMYGYLNILHINMRTYDVIRGRPISYICIGVKLNMRYEIGKVHRIWCVAFSHTNMLYVWYKYINDMK